MGDPFSAHRYLYGYANPINNIDPSGTTNITELVVLGGVITNLAAIGVGTISEAGQQAYADFGEYIFPDAFILGANGYISIDLLRIIGSLFGLSLPHRALTYNEKIGGEILFSVSSGQIAFFRTRNRGVELGYGISYGGAEVYRGMVWNLWNAYNYEGPFNAWNLNLGSTGGGIFFDAKNQFNGSWGLGRSVWSTSKNMKFSLAYDYIDYKFMPLEPLDYPSEGYIVGAILTTIYVSNIFVNSQHLGTPLNIAGLVFDTTLWIQTGIAKHFWGQKRSEYLSVA